jgi:hypothetical protein
MIPLTKREGEDTQYALCSLEDVEELKKYKWHKNKHGYVCGKVEGKKVAMHIFVKSTLQKEDIPSGYIVDHIEGNLLDNRRHLLRVVSRKINARNKRKRK